MAATGKVRITRIKTGQKGGAGSGNFGHAGRPGKLGGSIPKGGGGGAGKPAEPSWLTDESLQSKRQLDKTKLHDMTDAEQYAARAAVVKDIQAALAGSNATEAKPAAKTYTATQIRKAYQGTDSKLPTPSAYPDKIVAKADGSLEFRKNYFYKMGHTEANWAATIQQDLKATFGLDTKPREVGDHYADWPKTSYFYAVFDIAKTA